MSVTELTATERDRILAKAALFAPPANVLPDGRRDLVGLSREELARLANMSQRQLQRLFREHLGMTPTHYYLTLRLRRARELLLQTDMSIMHITMACGFQSACHFSKSYRDAFGTAPTRERRKQVAPLAHSMPAGAPLGIALQV